MPRGLRSPLVGRTVSGCVAMTSSPLRTVWGVGEISVSRIGLTGILVPPKSVSARGCSPGTASVTMTRAPVRSRSVNERPLRSMRN